ncbi:MAG: hypothetical protein AB2A00_39070 [Myxococcota bacterium]
MPFHRGVVGHACSSRVVGLLLSWVCACAQGPLSHQAEAPTARPAPVELPRVDSAPQPLLPPPEGASRPVLPRISRPLLDARILVLSADGTEPVLSAITQLLDAHGTPYTVWVAASREPLAARDLSSGTRGFYQGIFLTTAALVTGQDGTARSALTPSSWQALWEYEAAFNVREVAWYAAPSPGLAMGEAVALIDTRRAPLTLTLTDAGTRVFPDVNAQEPVVVESACAYLARPHDARVTPLLGDPDGHVLAGVTTHANGTETLFLTFDGNPSTLHTLQLGHGLLRWVTRGVFLGQRRISLTAHVDGVFLATPTVEGRHYRVTADDLHALQRWQASLRKQSAAGAFKLDLGVHPGGLSVVDGDPLLTAAQQLGPHFRWTSQPFANAEPLERAAAGEEMRRTLRVVARELRLNEPQVRTVLFPGLPGADLLIASQDVGVRYLVADGAAEPGPEDAPQVLVRRSTNLFPNVTTPRQWTTQYNQLHRTHWGRDLTYDEILDRESLVIVAAILRGDSAPLAFHQANLHAYDGNRSLVVDLLDRVFQRCARLTTLPIQNPTPEELGWRQEKRAQLGPAGVRAVVRPGVSLTVSAERNAMVPVTGIRNESTDDYGGEHLSLVALPGGRSVTHPIP